MHPETAMWMSIALVVMSGSGLVAALFLGPIGRALGDRIRGSRGDGITAAVEDLEHRLQDMEERLDFAERVITRGDDTPRPSTPVPQ